MTRTLQWLFLVSVLLFVCGIGFVIAAGRTVRAAPASAGGAATTAVSPVATVKQVMRGITMPAAATIWDSVSTIVDAKGVTENVPKNDAEWAVVGANAAVLAESANMLMTGDRAVDIVGVLDAGEGYERALIAACAQVGGAVRPNERDVQETS